MFSFPTGSNADPMYRPGFLPPPAIPIPAYNNKNALHSLATAASSNGTIFYNAQAPYFSISSTLLGRDAITGVNTTGMNARTNMRGAAGQQRNGAGKRKDYQLKVGGKSKHQKTFIISVKHPFSCCCGLNRAYDRLPIHPKNCF